MSKLHDLLARQGIEVAGIIPLIMDYLEANQERCETCQFWNSHEGGMIWGEPMKCPCTRGHGSHSGGYWCTDWKKLMLDANGGPKR